ncbi:MAG: hypothetical protein HWE16_04850 [Gammaproteobacteria bacterium]|nr:hypothetical protein [Gammaproteobacteria bacterium]
MTLMRIFLFVLTFLILTPAVSNAKDKAIANQYPIILVVNDSGKVSEVITEQSMPETIKQKTLDAFVGRKVGIKRKFGRAIAYKQKITISTKHLIDNSQISQR